MVSPGAREVTLPAGVVIDLTTWNAPSVALAAGLAGPVLQPERSRVPVDPYTFYVVILLSPGGQVIQGGAGGSNGDFNTGSPMANQPFYHFWLTEREGVVPSGPLWGSNTTFANSSGDSKLYIPNPNPNYGATVTSQNYLLPMPKGTPGYTPMPNGTATGTTSYSTTPVYLTGERRLVTLFVKTGQIVTNSIESFNVNDTNQPFYDAQSGTKESQ